MKKKILIALAIITAFVGLAAVAGVSQAYLNYEREKEEMSGAIKRVKIISAEKGESGLYKVSFVPLNKQVYLTIHSVTAPMEKKITDLFVMVRSDHGLKPGDIGELLLVKDARPFGIPGEFVFVAERKESI
jgi:hypothetical protein